MKGNNQSPITSVSEHHFWMLAHCATLKGRSHIDDVIQQINRFTLDSNPHIRHMFCFSIAQLAQNRLTCLLEDENILFLDDDFKNALEKSKRIEEIVCKLRSNILCHPSKINFRSSTLHSFEQRTNIFRIAVKVLKTLSETLSSKIYHIIYMYI